MKKLLILIMLFPSLVFAYSKYILVGGDTLGIEVNSKGVVVVGFYEVNGEYINKDLKVGDRIVEVNNEEINSATELIDMIDKYIVNDSVSISYYRGTERKKDELNLKMSNGIYKTGLYVKASILGIGTLTYVDPGTKIYGVLGHGLNMSQTNKKIEVRTGYTYEADVTSFTRSIDGNPGSKNANINKHEVFGTIEENTEYGIFGKVNEVTNGMLLEVGTLEDIKMGEAYIYTTNVDDEVVKYKINIIDVDKKDDSKNIYFEIEDKALEKMSGGIVQGMSGSPIVQGDKIIGAVTRVLVEDVSKGYGISIVTMLETGDTINREK